VTDRALAIAAQLAVQSLVTFLSTLVALFEFEMEVTSLFIGAFCEFAALGVGLVALGRRHVSSSHASGSVAPPAPPRLRQGPGSSTGPAGLVKMRSSQARSVCMRLAFWAMRASITAC